MPGPCLPMVPRSGPESTPAARPACTSPDRQTAVAADVQGRQRPDNAGEALFRACTVRSRLSGWVLSAPGRKSAYGAAGSAWGPIRGCPLPQGPESPGRGLQGAAAARGGVFRVRAWHGGCRHVERGRRRPGRDPGPPGDRPPAALNSAAMGRPAGPVMKGGKTNPGGFRAGVTLKSNLALRAGWYHAGPGGEAEKKPGGPGDGHCRGSPSDIKSAAGRAATSRAFPKA